MRFDQLVSRAVNVLGEHKPRKHDGSTTCESLLGTYSVRLEDLGTKKGAMQLRSSVAELVAKSGGEHSFTIFFAGDDGRPLGCLRVVSKLDVTPERWAELWCEPA